MTGLEYYRQELATLSDELKVRIEKGDYDGACEILEQIDNLERQMYPTPEEMGCSL